jgi:hypothetical protein
MAIRDIVSRGFGNGTYSPGVNKLPTRGYAIGAAADVPTQIIRVNSSLTLPTRINSSLTLPTRINSSLLDSNNGD